MREKLELIKKNVEDGNTDVEETFNKGWLICMMAGTCAKPSPKKVVGWSVNNSGIVIGPLECSEDTHLFHTKELAEASVALAKLLRLRDEVNGDWIPNWQDMKPCKYCFTKDSGIIVREEFFFNVCLFSFPSALVRDEFMKKNAELIDQAKPLL